MNAEISPFNGRVAEAVKLLSDGLSAKEIAHRMNISTHTVNSYIGAAKLTVGVRTSIALAVMSVRKGWVQ